MTASDKQLSVDLRVGRKYKTVTMMFSQNLEDFEQEAAPVDGPDLPNGGRPCMGASVNLVLDAFRDVSLAQFHPEHGPAFWIAATAMFTDKGQMEFRWMPDGLHVVRADLGSRPGAAVATSKATDREYTELEENLAKGMAQITMARRVDGTQIVLHQATARSLPMDVDEPQAAQPERPRG
jgi:hypothetical protein